MAVKLHRCGNKWLKIGAHPCWRVQKALDESGIDYEVVEQPKKRGTRALLAIQQVSLCVAASPDYIELTGQTALPAIELEDGTVIRDGSKDLAARIREGRLSSPAGGSV